MTEVQGRRFLRWIGDRSAALCKRWDWMVAFTGLLIIVGLLQSCILYKTDETLREQQRAWLAPRRLAPPENFLNKKNQYTEVEFQYENVGGGPALGVSVEYGRDIVTLNEFRDQTVIANKVRGLLKGRECDSIVPERNGPAIFPKAQNFLVIGFPTELVQKINAESHYAIVVACLAYRSVGGVHRSRFCHILEPKVRPADQPNKWRSTLCSIHNDAD
jgi:hypothetical protein